MWNLAPPSAGRYFCVFEILVMTDSLLAQKPHTDYKLNFNIQKRTLYTAIFIFFIINNIKYKNNKYAAMKRSSLNRTTVCGLT